jgi:hypothetical protein
LFSQRNLKEKTACSRRMNFIQKSAWSPKEIFFRKTQFPQIKELFSQPKKRSQIFTKPCKNYSSPFACTFRHSQTIVVRVSQSVSLHFAVPSRLAIFACAFFRSSSIFH